MENEAEWIYPKRPAHGDNTEIMSMLIRGVLLFEEGDQVEGLETLHEAFTWETSTDPPKDGPAIPFIPSFEIYAKYLLKANDPATALTVLSSGNYTSSRNRGASVYMFAQANAMLGNTVAACDLYQRFVEQFSSKDLFIGEFDDAQSYLNSECAVKQVVVAKVAGVSPIPRTFAALHVGEGSQKKREMLKNPVWDWSNHSQDKATHC